MKGHSLGKLNTRRVLCPDTGKVVHFTQLSAQRTMNRDRKLKEYKCKHCGYFHLTKRRI